MFIYGMPRTSAILPLKTRQALKQFGSDLKDARRRRRLPTAVVAERAQISLPTLRRVERGDASVSLGVYATVLWALGLSERLGQLAAPETDTVGMELEEERLPKRIHLKRLTPPRAQ